MNKIKLGIVGHGFVGKAVDEGFRINVEKFVVDPIYKTSIKELVKFNPDFIFVCLPTPMLKNGDQDTSILLEVFSELNEKARLIPKILKSTILPNTLIEIFNACDNVLYNPEFLREKHANEDFENAPFIILAGENNLSLAVEELYINNSSCKTKNFIHIDPVSASLIKYSLNSFLATKVIFFNQIKKIFDASSADLNWAEFTEILAKDGRIGSSHMEVPGHDGKKGYGGACFTKDTAALYKYSEEVGEHFSLLGSAININNSIRREYRQLDSREKDQNVNYEIDK